MNTIDFAIDLEQEGQKYYLEQAELNKDNELYTVFILLAESEKLHEELLKKRKEKEAYVLRDDYIRPNVKPVFRELKSFDQAHREKQLDVYRLAVSQEEKSIELYQDLKKQATELQDNELFNYLIHQEQEHLILFEELVTMLTRPEEWVESAEFGIREEY
jgi:rubrerythrin